MAYLRERLNTTRPHAPNRGRLKSFTTKNTKVHEGFNLKGFPSCYFVSFVVKVYCSAENSAAFHRLLSSVQQTLALAFFSRSGAQAARFRSSAATFRRSTTVMPRVNSPWVSTSM